MTIGYIQFVLIGSQESKGGLQSAMRDENTVCFDGGFNTERTNQEAREIKEYIENYIHERSAGSATASNLDEIRKLKELLDIGAITDEEFEAKKAQLLNI